MFHPDQTHKFLKCRVTETICRECNMPDELVTAIYNSEQSTRRLLAERGVDPDGSNNNMSIEAQVNARRVAAEVRIPSNAPAPITISAEAPIPLSEPAQVSPPTPPRHQQDMYSDTSGGSFNSNNHAIEPYLRILKN